MIKTQKHVVTKKQSNQRFDVAATELFNDLSRKKIKDIIDNGGAYLNKKRIKIAKIPVYEGDVIEIFFNEKAKQAENVSKSQIIFESEEFLVVDKPAGIPSQATLDSVKGTIIELIHKVDKIKFPLDSLFLVHRLDKETSGIMLIARTKAVQEQFENLFKERQIIKTYKALCYGIPKKDDDTIKFSISKDPYRKNTYVANMHERGQFEKKEAETKYTVEKKYESKNLSLIKCEPKTGRTHQIRVHMAAIGCPILGDKTYAQNIYGHAMSKIALRHMLHAHSISFTLNAKEHSFQCHLPADFKEIISRL